MREIDDKFKETIKEYSKKYPMYYDLLEYTIQLENELKEISDYLDERELEYKKDKYPAEYGYLLGFIFVLKSKIKKDDKYE